MRFVPTTRITDAANALIRSVYAWLDFMRTASPGGPGWSVVRSSNGTNYTDDGVGGLPDNIASWSDLNNYVDSTSRSYFVLRSPDLGGGTYRELLWYRINTTNLDWACRTARVGAANLYTGGDLWNIPTSPTSSLLFQRDSGIGSNSTSVLHMGADDAAPYGFWVYSHNGGDFASPYLTMAYMPITAGIQPNDGDPFVFTLGEATISSFSRDTFCVENDSIYNQGCHGFLRTGWGCVVVPGLYYRNVSNIVAPATSGLPPNEDDEFLGFPIPFGRAASAAAPTGFKGWTDFVLWYTDPSGVSGKTYASGSWIQWGSLLFPWDGSVPEIS